MSVTRISNTTEENRIIAHKLVGRMNVWIEQREVNGEKEAISLRFSKDGYGHTSVKDNFYMYMSKEELTLIRKTITEFLEALNE